MAKPDLDPYQRYGSLVQEIRTYSDRPQRRRLVDPKTAKPFGVPVTIYPPDEVGSDSILFFPQTPTIQVSGDEEAVTKGEAGFIKFGPFEQVVVTPTIQARKKTTSITYRNLGDLFF